MTPRIRTLMPPSLILVLALVLLVAGCGGSGEAASQGSAATTPEASASNGAPSTPGAELTKCLEEQGVQLPDRSQGGGAPGQPPEGFDPSSGFDPSAIRDAIEKCGGAVPEGGFPAPGSGAPAPGSGQAAGGFQRFAACMKRNGVELPGLGDSATSTPNVDPTSPKYKKAQARCQALLRTGGGESQ